MFRLTSDIEYEELKIVCSTGIPFSCSVTEPVLCGFCQPFNFEMGQSMTKFIFSRSFDFAAPSEHQQVSQQHSLYSPRWAKNAMRACWWLTSSTADQDFCVY